MSRELTPRAIERLLEVGAPLRDEPESPDLTGAGLERYELGPELGRGGMGIVYEAWDTELGRKVALKVLARPIGSSEAARSRFVREAKAAARLTHPHIATVYDATADAIAMQRVVGESLADRTNTDAREVAALVRDAALAIHYAHGEGIVHRDIKPANLMVDDTGERPHVYVCDFGLAKESEVESSVSQTGHVVGTPAYMAPEQAAGRARDVGPATDVYGLGATLYGALAGAPPFEDDDVLRLLRRVAEDEPPPLAERAAGVDRDLSTIVAKCMEKEPSRRYASALELAGDLDRWLRGEAVHARPASVVYRLRRYVSRRQGAIVTGLVAAGIVVLAALPFLVRSRLEREEAVRARALAERVFALSERVNGALRDARSVRESGVGYESGVYPILQVAIEDCRDFIESNESAWAHFFLGQLLREQGRPEEASEAFDRAVELAPDLPRLREERGLAFAALYRDRTPVLGEPPPPELETWRRRGIEDLELALAEELESPTANRLFAEGQLAWLRGDLAEAIERQREAIERDLAHQEAHLSLARLYLLTGRESQSFRHSVIATDLLRGLRPSYVAQANVRGSSGELILPERELVPIDGMPELLVDFNLLLQVDPGDANTYGLRGQVHVRHALRALERDDADGAVAHLGDAVREYSATITLDPEHAPALVNRGVCHARLARVHAGLGESLAASRSTRAALDDYGAALAVDPDSAAAWFDRALLHRDRAHAARFALAGDRMSEAFASARADVAEALARASESDPWRPRFAELEEELP